MNCRYFTIEEYCSLGEYNVKVKSYRAIARLLDRNASSISRKLRQNCTFFRDAPRYYPYTAQRKSNLRNSYAAAERLAIKRRPIRKSNLAQRFQCATPRYSGMLFMQ